MDGRFFMRTLGFFILVSAFVAPLAFAAKPNARIYTTDSADLKKYLVPSPATRSRKPEIGTLEMRFDARTTYQEIEGYGATLTDSSILAIRSLPERAQDVLLRALFHPERGLNMSYLRVPLGATDFGTEAYTYLDLPSGEEDPDLLRFNFSRARDTVAMLQRIKRINPNLRLMLSPWSPPAWMKTSGHLNGGELRREHYDTYARYLVKSLAAFAAAGLEIDTVTIQNEPYHSTEKYPSLWMPIEDQVVFIRDYFHPYLKMSGLRARILGLDHNFDLRREGDALFEQLGDRIAGIAYHCYGGWYTELAGSRAPLYQTECSGGTWSTAPESLHFWLQTFVIGGGLLGTKVSLAWNLALNENHGPFMGYCDNCRGLVDVHSVTKAVTVNPELIALAHGGKFLRPGARRIHTDELGEDGLSQVAFRNPGGQLVFVVENYSASPRRFSIRAGNGSYFSFSVPAGGVSSVVADHFFL